MTMTLLLSSDKSSLGGEKDVLIGVVLKHTFAIPAS